MKRKLVFTISPMCSARYTSIILLCCLMACDSVTDRKDAVQEAVKSWAGKDIQVALDALGPPNKTRDRHGKKVYIWVTARQENMRTMGGKILPSEGEIDASDPSHFNYTVTCTINAIENPETHMILATRIQGQILVCAQFTERMRERAAASASLAKGDK